MKKKIKKSSLVKSFIDFTFFAQSCYNYEKLQSISFAQCMYHILKDLYDTPEEIGREMSKHTSFFNTETDIGCVIHGIVCAMEEERANTGAEESEITAESIVSVKTGLMGPFAGIGDSLFQGILSPLFISICVSIALEGNQIAPILLILLTCGVFLSIAYISWMSGYKMGTNIVDKLIGSNMMQYIMLGAGIVGCMAMGALVANNVSVYTPIKIAISEANTIFVQGALFDSILKGILPLTITLVTWYFMSKKNWSAMKMICVLTVVAFILGALGIITNVSPI